MRAMASPRQMRFPVGTGEGGKAAYICTALIRVWEALWPGTPLSLLNIPGVMIIPTLWGYYKDS